VLSLYPEFAEKIQKDIRHDLTYNLKEGFEDSEVCMTQLIIVVLKAEIMDV
jgi:hypothetical protein